MRALSLTNLKERYSPSPSIHFCPFLINKIKKGEMDLSNIMRRIFDKFFELGLLININVIRFS